LLSLFGCVLVLESYIAHKIRDGKRSAELDESGRPC